MKLTADKKMGVSLARQFLDHLDKFPCRARLGEQDLFQRARNSGIES